MDNSDQAENQLDWFAIRKIRFDFFRIDCPLSAKALPAITTVLKQSNTLLHHLILTEIDNLICSIHVPIFEHCTGIIYLTISGMALSAPLLVMISKLRFLEDLELIDCENLDTEDTVGDLCISVKSLSLYGKISIEIQKRLLIMCPNVVNYNLFAEDVELHDMPSTLESLCVEECTSIFIGNLNTNLRKLKIWSLEGDDDDFAGMFTSCLHLQELDLSCNGYLTDVTLIRIADTCSGTLTDLNIFEWDGVSCAAIKYLCEKCTKLSSLALGSYCGDFDPNCIIEALDHCPSLRTLDISCSTITDEVLVRIAAAPLEYLNMTRTTGFTDEALLAFGKGCAKLKKISISSDLLKDLWKELRPDLRIW